MHFKNLNKTYFAVILFTAALILLSIPIVRVSHLNPAIPGSEHYFQINHQTILLDFLQNYIPQSILAISFPLILAIASLFVFAKLVSRYAEHKDQIYYALIILVLTPAFIGLHIGLSNYQYIFFFGLLFALLYDMKTNWFYLPLIMLYVLNPLLGLILFLSIIVLAGMQERGKDALSLVFVLVGILIASNFLPIAPLSLAQVGLSFNHLFSFFNAKYGYSLFLIILGLGGIFIEKKTNIATVIIAASLFYEPLRILGIAVLAFYGAKSFHKLQEREWTINFLRDLTLVLFVCILLFGSSTYIKETIQDTPHKGHVDALFYLQENAGESKILTSPELTEFSTFMTGQEAVSSLKYFYSQQYKYIDAEFKEQDIGYVLIDKSMLSGKIWQHDEEGLLFLLKYNDNFKKVYENDEVQIYYFAPWRE